MRVSDSPAIPALFAEAKRITMSLRLAQAT